MKSGFQPEMKRASKEWSHSSSPNPKEYHMRASAGKVMLMLFLDHEGPFLEHYISKGTIVTIVSCCIVLRNHLRQPSLQTAVDPTILIFCCCMAMLGHLLRVWQLKRSGKFILSVTLICRTCLTSPLVTTMSLGCSRKDFLIWWKSAWVATLNYLPTIFKVFIWLTLVYVQFSLQHSTQF